MSDSVDELIKEIAEKHKIVVGRDDPILILKTINARLMQDSAKAQQEMLDKFKAAMEEITQRWEKDSKEKAERILNASLSAGKEAMNNILQEQISIISSSIQKEVSIAVNEIINPLSAFKKFSVYMLIGGCLTIITAIIFLVSIYSH
jgi:hypothetical protein